jgi:uncharacterized membrane protein
LKEEWSAIELASEERTRVTKSVKTICKFVILIGVLLLLVLYLLTGFLDVSLPVIFLSYASLLLVVLSIILLTLLGDKERRAGKLIVGIFVIAVIILMSQLMVFESVKWWSRSKELCEDALSSTDEKKKKESLDELRGWRYNNWKIPSQCRLLEEQVGKAR